MAKSNLQIWYKLTDAIVDNEDCTIWWKRENETFAVRTSKLIKQFASDKVYTYRNKKTTTTTTKNKQTKTFGFKKTHLYTVLKFTQLVKSAKRRIVWSITQVERAYSVTAAWGYYVAICFKSRQNASQSIETLKLNGFKKSTHGRKRRWIVGSVQKVLHWIDRPRVVPTFRERQTSE